MYVWVRERELLRKTTVFPAHSPFSRTTENRKSLFCYAELSKGLENARSDKNSISFLREKYVFWSPVSRPQGAVQCTKPVLCGLVWKMAWATQSFTLPYAGNNISSACFFGPYSSWRADTLTDPQTWKQVHKKDGGGNRSVETGRWLCQPEKVVMNQRYTGPPSSIYTTIIYVYIATYCVSLKIWPGMFREDGRVSYIPPNPENFRTSYCCLLITQLWCAKCCSCLCRRIISLDVLLPDCVFNTLIFLTDDSPAKHDDHHAKKATRLRDEKQGKEWRHIITFVHPSHQSFTSDKNVLSTPHQENLTPIF